MLVYFLNERSTRDAKGLTRECNLLRSVLVMIPTYHEILMACGPLGFLGGVLLIRENFPPLGKNCLLLSYDSLGIDADSTLEGVSSTPLGKSHFATLEGAALYPGPTGESFYDTKFYLGFG